MTTFPHSHFQLAKGLAKNITGKISLFFFILKWEREVKKLETSQSCLPFCYQWMITGSATPIQTVLSSFNDQSGTKGTRSEQKLFSADDKYMLFPCSTIYSERRKDTQIFSKLKYWTHIIIILNEDTNCIHDFKCPYSK